MRSALLVCVAVISLNVTVWANGNHILVYKATEDFTNINAGDVPYYVHKKVSALAINAANPAFRGKFARASTVFQGSTGLYNVILSALGETDGECEYRFLIDGQVQGTAVNSRVETDYEVQNHTFASLKVMVPFNATIAVESDAVSNGLIPENDIFAFARGRWTALILVAEQPPATMLLNDEVQAADAMLVGEKGQESTSDEKRPPPIESASSIEESTTDGSESSSEEPERSDPTDDIPVSLSRTWSSVQEMSTIVSFCIWLVSFAYF